MCITKQKRNSITKRDDIRGGRSGGKNFRRGRIGKKKRKNEKGTQRKGRGGSYGWTPSSPERCSAMRKEIQVGEDERDGLYGGG